MDRQYFDQQDNAIAYTPLEAPSELHLPFHSRVRGPETRIMPNTIKQDIADPEGLSMRDC
jgi:hypothetical protein